MRVNGKKINQMRAAERCPEKAGVGGSSPSLATTFSNTYRRLISSFGSNWFQFRLADSVSASSSGSPTTSNSLIPFNALKVSPCDHRESTGRSLATRGAK